MDATGVLQRNTHTKIQSEKNKKTKKERGKQRPDNAVIATNAIKVGSAPACWNNAGIKTIAGPEILFAIKLKPPQKPIVFPPPISPV